MSALAWVGQSWARFGPVARSMSVVSRAEVPRCTVSTPPNGVLGIDDPDRAGPSAQGGDQLAVVSHTRPVNMADTSVSMAVACQLEEDTLGVGQMP